MPSSAYALDRGRNRRVHGTRRNHQLFIANEKVRFEINNDAAVHRGITISPDLIAISRPQH